MEENSEWNPKIYHLKHLVGLLISLTAWIEYGLWPPSLSRPLELSINELPWFWDYEIYMMGPTWWVVWIIVLAWLSKLINNQIICPGRRKKTLNHLNFSWNFILLCWCCLQFFFFSRVKSTNRHIQLSWRRSWTSSKRKMPVWEKRRYEIMEWIFFSPFGLLIDMGTHSHGLLLLLKQEELEEERRKKVLLCFFCFPLWYFFN